MSSTLYRLRVSILIICLALGTALGSCSDDDSDTPATTSQAGTFFGEIANIGDGTVRAWVTLDDDGNPVSIGVTISQDGLTNLPDDAETSLVLTLPAEAAQTVFKHVYFNWNPHGHNPQGIFDVPHFDFHFYTTTSAEREAIMADGSDAEQIANLPDEQYRPPSYVPDQDPLSGDFFGVPAMGLHWTDRSDPAFNGNFTEIMIWGSYDGMFTFVEPMITVDFLNTNPDMTKDLEQPSEYQLSGYFPTQYSIRVDADTGDVIVSLDGLTMREGT